jgi:hypothetical protein
LLLKIHIPHYSDFLPFAAAHETQDCSPRWENSFLFNLAYPAPEIASAGIAQASKIKRRNFNG